MAVSVQVVCCSLCVDGNREKKSDFVKSNLLNTHYRVLPCDSDGARLTFHSLEKDRFIACILTEQNFLGRTTRESVLVRGLVNGHREEKQLYVGLSIGLLSNLRFDGFYFDGTTVLPLIIAIIRRIIHPFSRIVGFSKPAENS